MNSPAPTFRLADEGDAVAVRTLDELAFGPGGQRAEPGELEAAVVAGDVHVLDLGGVPVGYLHADTSRANRIYVAGVAVHPGVQGHGWGSALIDHMLALLGDERHLSPVVTVTSPHNVRMLKVLLQRGFSARWFLQDHFGPGQHRFGCQLLAACSPEPRGSVRVSATRLDQVSELMRIRGLRVRSIIESAGEAGKTEIAESPIVFELVPIHPSDFLAADPPDHRVDPAELQQQRLDRAIQDSLGWSHQDGTW
jgi:GNAT superfamily N-acetyltransferase